MSLIVCDQNLAAGLRHRAIRASDARAISVTSPDRAVRCQRCSKPTVAERCCWPAVIASSGRSPTGRAPRVAKSPMVLSPSSALLLSFAALQSQRSPHNDRLREAAGPRLLDPPFCASVAVERSPSTSLLPLEPRVTGSNSCAHRSEARAHPARRPCVLSRCGRSSDSASPSAAAARCSRGGSGSASFSSDLQSSRRRGLRGQH